MDRMQGIYMAVRASREEPIGSNCRRTWPQIRWFIDRGQRGNLSMVAQARGDLVIMVIPLG